MYPTILAHTVLVLTSAVLFYVAWTDLRHYKIRNELIVVLVILFVIHAFLSGRWVEIYWNFAVALVAFFILLVFYIRNGMGGGDIKLLTVGLLWVGYSCLVPFAVFLLIFSFIHAMLAKLGWVKTTDPDRKRIPFAPSIAAALIGTFMLGCVGQSKISTELGQNRDSGLKVSVPQSR